MNPEQDIQRLLIAADMTAGKPPVVSAEMLIAAVRQKQSQYKTAKHITAGVVSAAAMLAVIASVWAYQSSVKQRQIVRLQEDIDQLNRRIDGTLALVTETLRTQRERETLEELNTQLLRYDQSLREFEMQEEASSVGLLIQAARMEEADLTQAAQNYYDMLIRMYPDTPGASAARQKLRQFNSSQDIDMKGNRL
jgi:hypothetical protein